MSISNKKYQFCTRDKIFTKIYSNDELPLESKEFYIRFLNLCEFIYEDNSLEEKENELIEFFRFHCFIFKRR